MRLSFARPRKIGDASRGCSKRDRVECLSRPILYEQGGIPRIIAVLSQFSHDTMPMFPCGLMVRKMRAVRIVIRIVRGADHKMIVRHVLLLLVFTTQTGQGGQDGNHVGIGATSVRSRPLALSLGFVCMSPLEGVRLDVDQQLFADGICRR